MIAVIDYEAGNLRSVERAFTHLGAECRITADAEEILRADRVVFPGVGAAGAAMKVLRKHGLDRVIREVAARGTPLLGICLGAQVMLDESDEDGGTACLGLIPGRTRRFDFSDKTFKIPHMGWNNIVCKRSHPVLAGINDNDRFYFVHSYYLDPANNDDRIAETNYGASFVSVTGRGSLLAVQFHPEKSGPPGLRLLAKFSSWKGDS